MLSTEAPVAALPCILLVEDNPHDAELMQLAFAPYASQLSVHWAQNTVRALDYLAKRGPFRSVQTPQLILLDLHLPVFSGHNLLQQLADDVRWRAIPVVVLSGSNKVDDIDRSYVDGAMLYVMKPGDWGRWSDLATSFARLVGVAPTEIKPPTGRIQRDPT
jgi:CheY-like chemotaxis protein